MYSISRSTSKENDALEMFKDKDVVITKVYLKFKFSKNIDVKKKKRGDIQKVKYR